jgi:phosphatidylglycerol:prolipoprotein diacylglycerol transferase
VIDLPFDPNLELAGLRIAWHSVFSFLALLIGSQVSFRCARYLARDDRIYPFAIAVVIGGLIGARAGHVIDNWPFYSARPGDIVAFWNGGIAVTTAPIGSALAAILAARALRLPLGFMFDITVIGIVLGEAIGRIGDVINGEHHAVACSGLPWCVRYTHPATLGQSEFVHPVVAYDLIWDLLIFGILVALWLRVRGRPPEGRVFWVYLTLYGAGRFVSSFLRLDPVVLAGMQEAQVLGLVYVVVGTIALVVLTRRSGAVASTTVT